MKKPLLSNVNEYKEGLNLDSNIIYCVFKILDILINSLKVNLRSYKCNRFHRRF
jgi:hypothetical protein